MSSDNHSNRTPQARTLSRSFYTALVLLTQPLHFDAFLVAFRLRSNLRLIPAVVPGGVEERGISASGRSDWGESDKTIAGKGATADSGNTTSAWFLHPALDYLFACGGIVWLLFGWHYFLLSASGEGQAARALITLSAVGAMFLAEGHTAATLIRVYNSEQMKTQMRPWLYRIIPALTILLASLGTIVPGVAPVLVKIYMLVTPHHVLAQSYGIAKLYCIKHGYRLDRTEEFGLKTIMWLTIAFAVTRQLTYKQWSGSTFLKVPIPFWGPLPEPLFVSIQTVLIAVIATFIGFIVFKRIDTTRSMPLPAILTMATGIAAFSMEQTATGIFWLYVSAFFHATQYLLVVVSCHLKEHDPRTNWTPAARLKSLTCNSAATRMLGLVLLISVFVYSGLPHMLAAYGVDFTTTAATIFATFNLYHALVDSFIWRLRRPKLREAAAS